MRRCVFDGRRGDLDLKLWSLLQGTRFRLQLGILIPLQLAFDLWLRGCQRLLTLRLGGLLRLFTEHHAGLFLRCLLGKLVVLDRCLLFGLLLCSCFGTLDIFRLHLLLGFLFSLLKGFLLLTFDFGELRSLVFKFFLCLRLLHFESIFTKLLEPLGLCLCVLLRLFVLQLELL